MASSPAASQEASGLVGRLLRQPNIHQSRRAARPGREKKKGRKGNGRYSNKKKGKKRSFETGPASKWRVKRIIMIHSGSKKEVRAVRGVAFLCRSLSRPPRYVSSPLYLPLHWSSSFVMKEKNVIWRNFSFP